MFTPDAPALPARSLPGLLHGLVQTQPDALAIRWLDTATAATMASQMRRYSF